MNSTQQKITEAQQNLTNHPIFSAVTSVERLRCFMETHVFAVWDFMTLVKRLQCDLTCITNPWIGVKDAESARLINEIVCSEETDILPDGTSISHFDMYRLAMKEIGANTGPIDTFIEFLLRDYSVHDALTFSGAPEEAKKFVLRTIAVASRGNLIDVAADFLNGRESIIPNMFRSLLSSWTVDETTVPMFIYYLNRHICLDENEHGPASNRMLMNIVKQKGFSVGVIEYPSLTAIQARVDMWNELHKKLLTLN